MQFSTIFSVVALLGATFATPIAEPEPVAEPQGLGVGGFLFNCKAGYTYEVCCPGGVKPRLSNKCEGANQFLTGYTCPIPEINTRAIAYCCKQEKAGVYSKCYKPAVISI